MFCENLYLVKISDIPNEKRIITIGIKANEWRVGLKVNFWIKIKNNHTKIVIKIKMNKCRNLLVLPNLYIPIMEKINKNNAKKMLIESNASLNPKIPYKTFKQLIKKKLMIFSKEPIKPFSR